MLYLCFIYQKGSSKIIVMYIMNILSIYVASISLIKHVSIKVKHFVSYTTVICSQGLVQEIEPDCFVGKYLREIVKMLRELSINCLT